MKFSYIIDKLLQGRLFLAAVLCGSLFVSSCALSPGRAKADLAFLGDSIKSIHPDAYQCITEERFDSVLQSEIDSIDYSITKRQLWCKVAKILALLNDCHCRADEAAMSIYNDYARQKGRVVPLLLYSGPEGQVLVSCDIENDNGIIFKKDDLLLSVNNIPIDVLIQDLQVYVAGRNSLQKKQILLDGFPVYYWLVYGAVDRFEIEVVRNGEKERVATEAVAFPGSKRSEDALAVSEHNEDEDLYSYKFYENNKICFLKLQNCNPRNIEKFRYVFGNLVSEMEKSECQYLIVDIRDNGGGNEEVYRPLMDKITNKSYKSYSIKRRYSKAYQDAIAEYGLRDYGIPFSGILKHLHLEKVFFNWPDSKDMNGEWVNYPSSSMHSSSNSWDKKLVLLCGRNTYSAAVILAAIVKDNQLGLIVGEETGGRASFNGLITSLYLPCSDLRYTLPSAEYIRPNGVVDRQGVQPDIEIDINLSDAEIVSVLCQNLFDDKAE